MAAAVVERGSSAQNTKQDLLTKVVHLESRVQSLERERNNHLFNRRNEFRSVFSGLEEADIKFSLDRKNDKQELKQTIERIRSSVAAFKRMLTEMRPGPTFVEALKKAMEEIEASITAFKEKQRNIYEELLREEKTVDLEVTAFEKKLESWLAAKPSLSSHTANSATVSTHGAQPTPSTVPPAVMAFERFLQQTGGRQGGWDEYDHQTFLKIRTKFNGHPSYIEAAVVELPTKTTEEIIDHDQWYSEYCTLLESKKKAIHSWKKQKHSEKTDKIKSTLKQQSKDDVKAKNSSKEEQLTAEREERFKKLTEWKAQQETQRKQDEEEKLKAKIEMGKKAEKDRRRKAALKAQVQEYTKERERARQVEKQREEFEKAEEMERRRIATKEVEKFRERDFKELQLKKEKEKQKEAEMQERDKALEKLKETVAVKVKHDPSRLFKLTAGWEERKKAATLGSGIGGPVLSLPRRAVPSWRQGL